MRRCLLLILLLLCACSANGTPATTGSTSAAPSTAAVPLSTLPPASPAPNAGIALREYVVPRATGRPARAVVLWLDPARVQVRVGYTAGAPRALDAWLADAPQALAVINGGYFDAQNQATALVVQNAQPSGSSYVGFGGMLAQRTDGTILLRALRDEPYAADEPLAEAIQSAPMLVYPGGQAVAFDDQDRARRTAVGLDRAGRLAFIVCPGSDLTLSELAEWLATGELQLERALNLDGGSSTGMIVRSGALATRIETFVPVPLVVFVEGRGP